MFFLEEPPEPKSDSIHQTAAIMSSSHVTAIEPEEEAKDSIHQTASIISSSRAPSNKAKTSSPEVPFNINVSDDECQVVEAKIKPLRKRKPSSGFKDFQYEVPGIHNKIRRTDSEIINLASSDEEVEPIRNGSSEPLPLPVPINKVPKVQLPPAHLKRNITTAATLITEQCLQTGTHTSSSPQRVHQLPPPLGNMELLIDLLEQMSRINSEFKKLFLEPNDEHCYVPTAHHKDWPRILTWSQMRTAYEQGYNYLSEVTKNEGYSKNYNFPHPSVFP